MAGAERREAAEDDASKNPMNIKLISKEKNGRVHFEVAGIHAGIANALRRTMLESVPTMAIEHVEIAKNSSALYDEVVAHRLGLLPLSTDLSSYTIPSECTCKGEGCAKCQLKMTLKASAPGWVTAEALKSKDPKVAPVHAEMPLVKLLKGQEIELEATAVLGRGKEHTKWSPGLIWHECKPTIKINTTSPKMGEFKDKYPKTAFDGGKLSKDKILSENLLDACIGVCDEIMSVEYSDTDFIFHIEPWGQLEAQEILSAACEVINKDLASFSEAFAKQ